MWSQKVLLIHNMAGLQEGDLARMMLLEQRKYGWPGLAQEVARLCEQLGLEHAAETKMNKTESKKEVDNTCRLKEHNMKKDMERIKDKKMKIMINENCDLKEYVKNGNIYSARKAWEDRYFMLRVAWHA